MINQMIKPNFAFWGTDEFSVKVLETLAKRGMTPSLIITVPDKPKGRKMLMTPPLVKGWGEENGVEVVQPTSLKGLEAKPPSEHRLGGLASKFDFFLVASYGKIIPQEILDIPTHETLNIHPSLLPKYRGPSPLETTILNGDSETGVTIIKLDAEMDHGPILAQKKLNLQSGQIPELNNKYNFIELRDKTAELGAELLIKILPDYLNDPPKLGEASKITPQEQDHDQATYTKKFTKADGRLDSNDSPIVNYRKILALNPWPGTYLDYPNPSKLNEENKTRVIIKEAHFDFENNELIYDKIIPAGRPEMTWADFLRGTIRLRAKKRP